MDPNKDKPAPTPDDNKPPVDDKKPGDDKKPEGGDSKTFTQEDLDKVVEGRLAKERKAAEERTQKAIADALAEQERKARMSDEEKQSEESKKKADELAERERNAALRENRAEARELLQEKSIDTSLLDWVVDPDLDKTKENVEKLAKAWDSAVEEAVSKKLAGKTPVDKTPSKDGKKPKDGDKASVHDLLYKKKG